MKVCTASQAVSTYGILSAMNSMTNSVAGDAEDDRMGEDLERLGELDDAEPLKEPRGRYGEVDIEPGRANDVPSAKPRVSSGDMSVI